MANVVVRFLVIAFIVFVLTIIGGIYITTQVLPKVYEATAQLEVRPRGVLSVPGLGTSNQSFDSTVFQSEFEIMRSPDLLVPIIDKLGLDKKWAKQSGKPGQEKLSPLEALAKINKNLKLTFVRGTDIVAITVASTDPQEAADIANGVVDQYKEMREAEEEQHHKRGLDTLRDQIDQQQKVVDERKAALEKIKAELDAKGIRISPEDSKTVRDLEARKKDLLEAQQDYDARQVLLKSMVDLPDDQIIDSLYDLGRIEPDIAELRKEVAQKQSDLDTLLKNGAKSDDPQVLTFRKAIDSKQRQIKDLVAGIRRAMKVDTDMAKSRVDLLQKEVDSLTAKIQDAPSTNSPSLQPYRDAQRELEQQQALLDALTIRLKQVQADTQLEESPVRIISRAVPPQSPSQPNRAMCIVVTALTAIFLSIGIASAVEVILALSRAAKKKTGPAITS